MNGLFRQEAIDRQSHRLEGDVLLLPKISHFVILILLALWLTGTIWWAATADYSRKERAPGVITKDPPKVPVITPLPGVVTDILVEEGQWVERGQPLAVVNDDSEERPTVGSLTIPALRSGWIRDITAVESQRLSSPGTSLMSLQPGEIDVHTILFVPVTAISHIVPGQRVNIRHDSFPAQKFGLYSGRVIGISDQPAPAAITNTLPMRVAGTVYVVSVELDSKEIQVDGVNQPLRSGMTLNADIVLERRTVLQWLLDSIWRK